MWTALAEQDREQEGQSRAVLDLGEQSGGHSQPHCPRMPTNLPRERQTRSDRGQLCVANQIEHRRSGRQEAVSVQEYARQQKHLKAADQDHVT